MYKMKKVDYEMKKFIEGVVDIYHFCYKTNIIRDYFKEVLDKNCELDYWLDEVDVYKLKDTDGNDVFCYEAVADDDDIEIWNSDIYHPPISSYSDFPTMYVKLRTKEIFWNKRDVGIE